MKFSQFIESQFIESDLNSLENFYVQDQTERQQYQTYLKKFPKWQEAAAQWAKDKNRNLNDLFNDAPRLKQAKKIITKNIEQIKSNQKMIKISWLLIQHMDEDVIFQQWFLNHLKKGTTEYEYLTDRVAVNNGLPQQYNTQNTQNI